MIEIRSEEPRDRDAVHNLNPAAFDGGPEAVLVDKLRATCKDCLAFVAAEDGTVVGHVLFTPVTVDDALPKAGGVARYRGKFDDVV